MCSEMFLGACKETEIHIGQGGYYYTDVNSHENSQKSWHYTPGNIAIYCTCLETGCVTLTLDVFQNFCV